MAIYNTTQGEAIVTYLTITNTTTNQTETVEYVLKNDGCYLVSGGSPFTGSQIPEAANVTAEYCTELCSSQSYLYNANDEGDCYCGQMLNNANLVLVNSSYCNATAPQKRDEIYGDEIYDYAVIEKRVGLPVQILEAIPASNVDIVTTSITTSSMFLLVFFLSFSFRTPLVFLPFGP